MKLIYLISFFLISTMAFQNCAGPSTGATSDSPVGIVSHQNKVVGLYNLSDIAKVHYYRLPISVELTIAINQPNPQASGAVYNSQSSCVLTPSLSADQYQQLLSLLPQTSLAESVSESAACGPQYLEITLKDGSSQTYPFQDGCQPSNTPSIANAQAQLAMLFSDIINASAASCSP